MELGIAAVHATPDDTATASVYTEVSAQQAWCFTVRKDNSAEGCWHCGAAAMPPLPLPEGPRAEPEGRGKAKGSMNVAVLGKGHVAGLPWPVLGPRTTLRSNSLGWESGLQGQSSWRAGVHFCSDPGLLCFFKKTKVQTESLWLLDRADGS